LPDQDGKLDTCRHEAREILSRWWNNEPAADRSPEMDPSLYIPQLLRGVAHFELRNGGISPDLSVDIPFVYQISDRRSRISNEFGSKHSTGTSSHFTRLHVPCARVQKSAGL
jgi:hypothetical protein